MDINLPRKIKSVILDFDGVILESADIKTEAFRTLFSKYPTHVDKIVSYHLENLGKSRYEKLRYIYAYILRKKLDKEKFNALCSEFERLVMDKLLTCKLVDGAYEFLENYHSKLSLFIVSSTPQDELESTVRKRELSKYFNGLFGAPTQKTEWLKLIIRHVPARQAVFVGDALLDYEAAKSFGIPFICRITKYNLETFEHLKNNIVLIKDINDLGYIIKSRVE